MKKLMLAVLVGLMVFATASIAAAEITVGGEMEVRYDLWNNLDLNKSFNENSSRSNTQTFFADRILLNVDAKITEGLEAFVEMDSVNSERVWGVNNTDGAVFSAVNYQGESLHVRQAWINFMVPGIPVGVKIGHQPLALGHGISLDTHRGGTDAILVYSKPIEQLLIAGVYAKVVEQSSSAPSGSFGIVQDSLLNDAVAVTPAFNGGEHHDADVWAALANFTFMPGNTVGVNYLYVHDAATQNVAANTSTGVFVIDQTTGLITFVPNTPTPSQTGALHLHNIGVTADGVIGPITYKAEVDYQNINGRIEGSDVSVNNSWAAMAGVGAKIAMVNLGAEVAYGTGTSVNKNAGSRTYLSPYGETSYNYAFLYNDKIGQGPMGTGGGFGFGDGTGGFGLANTGYIKLSAAVTPIDKLNVGMDVLYLRASSEAVKGQSRDLGWEVDAHAGYKIYDNLNLDVNGGVFIPGAYYQFGNAIDGTAVDTLGNPIVNPKALLDGGDASTGFKRSLAYGLETKLTVKF